MEKNIQDFDNNRMEVGITNQNCLEEEKYITMQTVDLCDITFSSFNDILLGDYSYFEDVSVSNPINNSIKPVQKLNVSSVDEGSQEVHSNEQKINPLNDSDNYNFYRVFEVIGKPVIQDGQTQTSHVAAIKCKSHKCKSHKKKRKVVTSVIKKGQRYLPNFKQKVLDYASSHTFKATALHFNINCNTITEWIQERKRLSKQQSTTSMPDSVCHYKTEIIQETPAKTDNINGNDNFTTETEINDNVLKTIEQDLPIGDMGSDVRFLEWIKMKRNEKKELSRNEVYQAAKICLNSIKSTIEHPIWFALWLKRYDKSLYNSEKSDNETEKYIMYPNNFKLEVALYAKAFTKNSAARVFNVPRRRIFDWFKYSDSINISDNSILNNGSALVITRDMKKDKTRRQIYADLHNWYQKKFEEGFSPNSNDIKSKARELFRDNGIGDMKFSEGWLQKFCKRLNIKLKHTNDDHLLLWILAQFDNNVSLSHQEITEKSSKLIGRRKEFKGSKGWTLRFLKRHSNFLQKVPKIDDKLPEIVQNDINKFFISFRSTLEIQKVNSSNIGCMDEIPVSFNYPQDERGMNLPLLRKTGFENCQAVVFLSMMADGRMLPPAVVLRGTGPRQLLSSGNIDILVLYQEKGVVDCEIMESWIEDVWLSCVSQPSILIVDSFRPHSSPELRKRLGKENCMLSIIPEGCSSRLQPLDIEITPTFKDMMRNQWKELPTNEASRKCRVPDQETIMLWIRNAYRKIESNSYSIINSFKIVGFID